MTPELGWAWHVHHDILCEPLSEPLEARAAFVVAHKPAAERAVRLRLLRPVQGALPPALVEARRASDEAWRVSVEARRVSVEAWRVSVEARRVSVEAWRAALPAVEAIHRLECPDCPWDGRTIFPA